MCSSSTAPASETPWTSSSDLRPAHNKNFTSRPSRSPEDLDESCCYNPPTATTKPTWSREPQGRCACHLRGTAGAARRSTGHFWLRASPEGHGQPARPRRAGEGDCEELKVAWSSLGIVDELRADTVYSLPVSSPRRRRRAAGHAKHDRHACRSGLRENNLCANARSSPRSAAERHDSEDDSMLVEAAAGKNLCLRRANVPAAR